MIVKMPDYDLVRTILGKDFISPEDVMKSRKSVVYNEDQLAQFGETVPSQEVLEWCRDNGYMLVAGPNRPLSLLEVIRALREELKEVDWYEKWKFLKIDKVSTRWIMLRKKPVPQSVSKPKYWEEQQALLSYNEVIPNAAEVVWCVTTFKVVRNTYLLPNVYVRTSSLNSDGSRVVVGLFNANGLGIDCLWDDLRFSNVGVSASRKL